MKAKAKTPETEPEELLVVYIGSTMLSGLQAEILYKAMTSVMHRLAERVSNNRFDETALTDLTAATDAAKLLARCVPKSKPAEEETDVDPEADE